MSAVIFESLLNGEIEVVKKGKKFSVLVNGFVESGPEVEKIWSEAFKKLISNDQKVANILILGFATGSVVKLIKNRWPNSKIKAVEIDPVMALVAREYFPQNLQGVDLVIKDAVDFVTDFANKTFFDLIIIDCYLEGKNQPEKLNTLDFLLKLKEIGEIVLMNQLILPNNPTRMKDVEFLRDLHQVHPIKMIRLAYNAMIAY